MGSANFPIRLHLDVLRIRAQPGQERGVGFGLQLRWAAARQDASDAGGEDTPGRVGFRLERRKRKLDG